VYIYTYIYIYICLGLWVYMGGIPEAAPNHRHQRTLVWGPVPIPSPMPNRELANLPLANWRILTAARAPSPFPSTSTSDPLPPPPRPTKSPRPPTGGPSPTDRPCPGSPPRLKPGAGRDKTAGGHHPRPVAGCCLRRGATGTPIGPRGLSCRGHPAKGPCRQFPRGLRISQQRTASA
jgi:hypothetical protein